MLMGRNETRYFVDIYQQPFPRVAIAWLYHKYDTFVYKMPGSKLIEKIHSWLLNKEANDPDAFYVPLSNEQDIRCFHLREKGRVDIARFEVTEEQYNEWKGSK